VLPLEEPLQVKHTQLVELMVEPREVRVKAIMLALHDLTELLQDMAEQVVMVMLVQVWLATVLHMVPMDNKPPLPMPVVDHLKEMLVDMEHNVDNKRQRAVVVTIALTKRFVDFMVASIHPKISINVQM